jgi:hypothetical protein
MGATHFQMTRLEHVSTEIGLHVLTTHKVAHRVRKLILSHRKQLKMLLPELSRMRQLHILDGLCCRLHTLARCKKMVSWDSYLISPNVIGLAY